MMGWVGGLITVTLIGIGSNFDNSGVGIAYGSKGIRFPHWVNAVVNVIGGGTAFVGAYLGDTISRYLTAREAAWAACVVLIGIGAFFWYTGYIDPLLRRTKTPVTVKQPQFAEGIFFGFALSFTNVASGFGATVSHATSIWTTTASIAVWGFLMIWLGNVLAIGSVSRVLGKYASFVAGLLLVLVGIHQVLV